jgi:hypothetical protein
LQRRLVKALRQQPLLMFDRPLWLPPDPVMTQQKLRETGNRFI